MPGSSSQEIGTLHIPCMPHVNHNMWRLSNGWWHTSLKNYINHAGCIHCPKCGENLQESRREYHGWKRAHGMRVEPSTHKCGAKFLIWDTGDL